MNPFILAGLVLTGVGLLQEAKDADGKPMQLLAGPEGPQGKPGKDGKTVVIPAKKTEKKKPTVEKPSDG